MSPHSVLTKFQEAKPIVSRSSPRKSKISKVSKTEMVEHSQRIDKPLSDISISVEANDIKVSEPKSAINLPQTAMSFKQNYLANCHKVND